MWRRGGYAAVAHLGGEVEDVVKAVPDAGPLVGDPVRLKQRCHLQCVHGLGHNWTDAVQQILEQLLGRGPRRGLAPHHAPVPALLAGVVTQELSSSGAQVRISKFSGSAAPTSGESPVRWS